MDLIPYARAWRCSGSQCLQLWQLLFCLVLWHQQLQLLLWLQWAACTGFLTLRFFLLFPRLNFIQYTPNNMYSNVLEGLNQHFCGWRDNTAYVFLYNTPTTRMVYSCHCFEDLPTVVSANHQCCWPQSVHRNFVTRHAHRAKAIESQSSDVHIAQMRLRVNPRSKPAIARLYVAQIDRVLSVTLKQLSLLSLATEQIFFQLY